MKSPAFRASAMIPAMACATLFLAGCGTRPTEAVLAPIASGNTPTETVTLVAATNRTPLRAGSGYDAKWAGKLSFERYTLAVPLKRNGTRIVYPKDGGMTPETYSVRKRGPVDFRDVVRSVTEATGFDGSVAIFVHGFNNSYQEAVYRTAQMGADVTSGGFPVLFSWPSAARLTGYVADRDAAMSSRTDLSLLITAFGESAKVRRIILVGHSMGGFLSMEAARQLRLEGRDRPMGKLQIILASPDIDVDVFRSQLRDIGELAQPITVLVSKTDRALSASSFIAGDRQRVGKVDVASPEIEAAAEAERVRVIDISTLQSIDVLGHDRFAAFAKFGGLLVHDNARGGLGLGKVGAFVFDAARGAVSSPVDTTGLVSE